MRPSLIDLFSGSGGVTEGFKNSGFQVLAAVEWDHIAAQTYSLNHPGVLMFEDDIRNVSPVQMMEQLQLHEGDLTVLSACAPCQPFSRQNRSNKDDDRTRLILEVIPFVTTFHPKYVLMENVPGLEKGKNKVILEELIKTLRNECNYKVFGPFIVNAVDYGVPQFRKRLIVLCARDDTPLSVPETTHSEPSRAWQEGKERWRTVKQAFKGLSKLASGQKSCTDLLHRARKHTTLNLERLRHIPKNGGSRGSLPEELQLACHKKDSNDDKENVGYNDVYGRMSFNRPANTLTTGCTNITKGRYAHPTANRAITPREAARLQTFPDEYKFVGGYDQISVQIGNAVPVLLAEAFAKYLLELENCRD